MKKLAGILLTISAICAVSACNNPEQFTVKFDSNGGQLIESQIVTNGGHVAKPNDPIKNGYNFLNWTYEGNEWLFAEYTVDKDITLLANYSLISYSITYELNGGSLETSNPTSYTIEDSFELKEPTREGSFFLGWECNNNTLTKIEKGTYGDLVLTAKWTANPLNKEEWQSYINSYGCLEGNYEIHMTSTSKDLETNTVWESTEVFKHADTGRYYYRESKSGYSVVTEEEYYIGTIETGCDFYYSWWIDGTLQDSTNSHYEADSLWCVENLSARYFSPCPSAFFETLNFENMQEKDGYCYFENPDPYTIEWKNDVQSIYTYSIETIKIGFDANKLLKTIECNLTIHSENEFDEVSNLYWTCKSTVVSRGDVVITAP